MEKDNILEALEYINASDLNYTDWVNVGMALKSEGYPCSVWDNWSSKDAGRYKAGECERKWETFNGASNPVTGGTTSNWQRVKALLFLVLKVMVVWTGMMSSNTMAMDLHSK